jgi:molecular chaperone GrpE (heat shock protein)
VYASRGTRHAGEGDGGFDGQELGRESRKLMRKQNESKIKSERVSATIRVYSNAGKQRAVALTRLLRRLVRTHGLAAYAPSRHQHARARAQSKCANARKRATRQRKRARKQAAEAAGRARMASE